MRHYSVVTHYEERSPGKVFPVEHPTEIWAKDRAAALALIELLNISYIRVDVTVHEEYTPDFGCGFYPELN